MQDNDTLRLKDKIAATDHKIEASIERITHQPKGGVVLLKNEDEDKESNGAIPLIIFVILLILGIILLGILFFYLFIAALNQAAEDAIESACYVATMSYGSYDHPKVLVLRRFRDRFLAKRKWGRQFIKWYYKHSPGFTKFYSGNKFVHFYLRIYLNLFVLFIKPFFKK